MAKGASDLLAHAPHVRQVQIAIAAARRADADQGQLAVVDRGAGVGGRAQAPGGDRLRDHVFETLLHDGALAAVDRSALPAFESTPMTLCPGARRHAAETAPT